MSTVLLVDDDWGAQTLVTLALGIAGTRVCALDGAEALEVLTREQVDLVILDLETPTIDSRLTFQEARSAGYEAPIVIMSAFGDERAAGELAADDVYSKPVGPRRGHSADAQAAWGRCLNGSQAKEAGSNDC